MGFDTTGTINLKLPPLLFNCIRVALTCGILFVMFHYLALSDLKAVVQSLDFSRAWVAALLWIPNMGFQWLRWYMLLQTYDHRIGPRAALISLFGTFPAGLITPGRIGELGRALFLPGHNWKIVSFLAMLDRATLMAAVVIWGVPSLYYFQTNNLMHLPEQQAGIAIYFQIIVVLLLLAIAGIIYRHIKKRWAAGNRSSLLNASLKDPGFILKFSIISISFVPIFCLQHYFLFSGLTDVPAVEGLAGIFIVHLLKSLAPFSIGDLGVREGAAIFVFSRFMEPEAAASGTFLLFLLNVALPALIGLPIFLTFRKKHEAVNDEK